MTGWHAGKERGMKWFWLAASGALGTLARYGLAGWVQRAVRPGFPFGTLAVNGAGCLLAGVVWALAEHRVQLGGEARTAVMVGFLGGFTTFSAYILETGELLRDGQGWWAAGNIGLQTGMGLAAFFAGLALGRWL